MKLKWFEAVKYKIVPTNSLSHFFEVNRARKVEAVKEVTGRNTKVISLSKYQFGHIYRKREKVYYKLHTKKKHKGGG